MRCINQSAVFIQIEKSVQNVVTEIYWYRAVLKLSPRPPQKKKKKTMLPKAKSSADYFPLYSAGLGVTFSLWQMSSSLIHGDTAQLVRPQTRRLFGRASDRHAAEVGSILRGGKRFSSQSTFSADSLLLSKHPHVQLHALASVCTLKIL